MKFVKSTSTVLTVELSGETVRAVAGSMVAAEGEVTFKRSPMGGGEGFMGAMKRKVAGEGMELMDCSGNGLVHFAILGAHVETMDLQGDEVSVEASNLLAWDSSLRTSVTFAGLHGMSSGQGLFTTLVQGRGTVAFLSHGGPLISLGVEPGMPLVVDPDALVASRGQLNRSFVTDVSFRSVVGGGGGEPFSVRFEGTGEVLVQPEERS